MPDNTFTPTFVAYISLELEIMDVIENRKKEFSTESYKFDLPHVLAEKAAEFILLYQQELASKEGRSCYCLISSDSRICVARTDNPIAFSYTFNRQSITYVEALALVATDTLIAGEERIS